MINFFNNVRATVPNKNVALEQIKQMVASTVLEHQTNKIRQSLQNSDGKKSDEFKRSKEQLPCVTFAGEFTARNNKSLSKYSGLIVIDIDGLESIEQAKELGEKLKVQQDVVLLFISPSGRGLKVVHQLKMDNTISNSDFHNSAFFKIGRKV